MTKRAAKWWLVGVGIGLLVFYVLSPGPVLRMLGGGMGGGVVEELFMILFYPLERLYDEVEWVTRFYDWWFEVWGTG